MKDINYFCAGISHMSFYLPFKKKPLLASNIFTHECGKLLFKGACLMETEFTIRCCVDLLTLLVNLASTLPATLPVSLNAIAHT